MKRNTEKIETSIYNLVPRFSQSSNRSETVIYLEVDQWQKAQNLLAWLAVKEPNGREGVLRQHRRPWTTSSGIRIFPFLPLHDHSAAFCLDCTTPPLQPHKSAPNCGRVKKAGSRLALISKPSPISRIPSSRSPTHLINKYLSFYY